MSLAFLFCDGCFACMHTYCLWRPEEDLRSHGTGVTEVVNCDVGVGIEPRSSRRAATALNHEAISPATPIPSVTSFDVKFLKLFFYEILPFFLLLRANKIPFLRV